MGILMGLLSMVLWGTAIFLAALASRKIGNILTLFWMQLFGLLAGTLYLVLNHQAVNGSEILHFIPVIIVIAVLQMVAYLAFYKGLERGKVSLVSPIGASWGIIVALLGVLFYKESLKGTQIFALVLIMSGVIVLSIRIQDLLRSKKVNLFSGVKEGVIALFGWGVSLFLLAIPTKELNWFLPAFMFRFFLILFLSCYLFLSKTKIIPKKIQFPFWLLVFIGIFDIGAFMSFSFGLSKTNASVVGPIGSAYAIISILLAKIILKEKIEVSQIIGIGSVILGLILISL